MSKRRIEDPRFIAAFDMLRRTGARSVQVRYDDGDQEGDDPDKTVWMAIAEFGDGRWDVGAAREPVEAVFRLCVQLIDGGTCTHCNRSTAFDPETWPVPPPDEVAGMPVCWILYDPKARSFGHSCGFTPAKDTKKGKK